MKYLKSVVIKMTLSGAKLAVGMLVFFVLFLPSKSLFAEVPYGPERTPIRSTPQIDVDVTSGAFINEFPLVIPPGRNGLQPNLKLQYNSHFHNNNGPFGYGWSIDIPYIERIPREGVDRLYTGDEGYFYSSLSGELQKVPYQSGGQEMAMMGAPEIGEVIPLFTYTDSISVIDQMNGLPLTQKSTLKGQAIAHIGSISKTKRNEYFIQVVSMNVIQGGVEVFARVWDAKNKQIGFGRDGSVDIERFVFSNPPILVPDKKGEYERRWIDIETGEEHVAKYREDVKEALLQALEETLAVKKQVFDDSNIVRGKVGNTTLTAYPNAGTGSAPIDGYMEKSDSDPGNLTFSELRNGAGTGVSNTDTSGVSMYLKLSSNTDKFETMRKSGYGFDTSSIGTDVIDSATFSLYANTVRIVSNFAGSDVVELVEFSPNSESSFVSSDYATSTFGVVKLATGVDLANITTSAYNDWVLNSTGTSTINTTGNTFLGTIWKWDFDDNFPYSWESDNTYLNSYFADHTGTTQDPKLVVEHSLASNGPTAPTSLLTETQTDPTEVTDITPEFSAIYNDVDEQDVASYFQIQVSATSTAWTTLLWDSTKTALASTTSEGNRIADISYASSTPLTLNGRTYYWRIRFWDDEDNAGEWSSGNDTFTMKGYYGPKVENGDFLRHEFVNDEYWVVTDKQGTKYTFGQTSDSRQDNNDGTKVFRWMLEEVRDTNDNYITYQYYKHLNQTYIASTTYTGHDTTDGVFDVDFLREERGDVATSTRTGFPVVTNYRINEIQAKMNGNWLRKYVLDYTTGDNATTTLLSAITESGKDENGNITTLPSTDFTYQSKIKSWTEDGNYSIPVNFGYDSGASRVYRPGVKLADVNGDGLVDIVASYNYPAPGGTEQVFINDGDGTGWTEDTNYSIPTQQGSDPAAPLWFSNGLGKDYGVRMFDINGDGYDDIFDEGDVYINDTNGNWVYDSNYTSVSCIFITENDGDGGCRIADVNGDGLGDLLDSSTVYLNDGDGTGWSISSYSVPLSFTSAFEKDNGTRLADINGDGLLDMLTSLSTGAHFYINDGDGTGWTEDIRYSIPNRNSDPNTPVYFSNGNGTDYNVRIVDINGDGFADLLWAEYNVQEVYINNADNTGWTYDGSYSIPCSFNNSGGGDEGCVLSDVDGDGLVDMIYTTASSSSVKIANPGVANKLKRVNTSMGSETTVSYKGSAEYIDTNDNILNPHLPFSLSTVETIATNDGLGNIGTTTFEYIGGDYYFSNPYDRKFAGFQKIKTINPLGYITIDYFHQGNMSSTTIGEFSDHVSKISKKYRSEIFDDNDNLYQKTINKWENYDLQDDRNFLKLTRSVIYDYDGDADHKDKATEYVYDDVNGNLIQRIFYGEVTGADDGTFTDTGSDLASTTIEYVASSTPHILGLPKREVTQNQSLVTVKEAKFYYDNLSYGNVDVGNETKQENWVTGSTYIDTEKTYNIFGLVTQETDPRHAVTNYIYDSYNLVVASSTNPLSQMTQFYYDYSSGNVATTTNANGFNFVTTYDGVGRVVEEKQPNIDVPTTLETKVSYNYTDTKTIRKKIETHNLDGATSFTIYKYLDGLDRVYQERKEAEEANVFRIIDYIYDPLGQLGSSTLPYFATGSATTTPTATSTLYEQMTYDPLLRVATTTNAMGETANVYDQWQLTVTDAKNNKKDIFRDAYNNIIQVNEHNGTSTYSTAYDYDVVQNLTKITDALNNIRNFTYDGLGRRLTAQDLHASADAYFGTWTYVYDANGNVASSTNPIGQVVDYYYDGLNRLVVEDYIGNPGNEIEYAYDWCSNGVGQLCSATSTGEVLNNAYNALGLKSSETQTINSVDYQTQYDYDRQGNIILITHPDNAETKYTYNTAGLLETVAKKEDGEGSYFNILDDIDYSPLEQMTYQLFGNMASSTYTYDPDALYRLVHKVTSVDGGGEEMLMMGGSGFSESEISVLSDVSTTTPITLQLEELADIEKATFKGQAIANLGSISKTERQNYFIEVLSMQAIQGGVQVFVKVWDKAGNQIGFGRDGSVDIERFVLINPPIMVPDEKGTYDIDVVDADGTILFTKTYAEDVKEALLQILEQTLDVKEQKFGDQNIQEGKVGNTTLTTYPNAGTGSAPIDGDGGLGGVYDQTFSNLRSTTADDHDDTATSRNIGYLKASATTDQFENLKRSKFGFDTSSIGTDSIDSATLSLYINSVTTGLGSTDIDIVEGNVPASESDLANGDFDISDFGSTRFATGKDISSLSTSAYNNYTLNASGESHINKSGNTWFGALLKWDVDNNFTGTWASGQNTSANASMADTTGTTQDPKLVVEHSVVGGGGDGIATSTTESLQDLNYKYDSVGNITQIFDIGGYDSAKVIDFLYDDLYRLTTASTTVATTSNDYIRNYAYDALGNITNKSDLGAYSYTGNTGVSYANPHAVTDINGTTYSYDKNGNLLSDSTWTHGWNYNNTLASSTNGVITVDYGYDHNKQRVSYDNGTKSLVYPNKYFNQSTGTTTRHIYAGDMLVATIETTGIATTTNYIHTDHLGGTHVVTDSSGDMVQLLDYYPFGEARINETSSFDEQRKFTGHEYDNDTDLTYANARYYDQGVGRFDSQDPVYLLIGAESFNDRFRNNWRFDDKNEDASQLVVLQYLQNPQYLNSYSYALNNPLKFIDPNGESVEISGALVVPGRTFSIGLRFDRNGVDGSIGGGFGVGLSAGISMTWEPGARLSHQREANITANGTATFIGGARLSGDLLTYYPDTGTYTTFDGPELAITLGAGFSGSVEQQLSKPLYVWGSGNSSDQSTNGGSSISSLLSNVSSAFSQIKETIFSGSSN